jgi:hypothetical protein
MSEAGMKLSEIHQRKMRPDIAAVPVFSASPENGGVIGQASACEDLISHERMSSLVSGFGVNEKRLRGHMLPLIYGCSYCPRDGEWNVVIDLSSSPLKRKTKI